MLCYVVPVMHAEQPNAAISSERLQHLEALAALVFRFIEEARYIDAVYDPAYSGLAQELRALGYQVRSDIPGA